MTVRVGVIGTGVMGADHVSTLHRQVSGAAVTMVADLDLERARALAATLPGVRAQPGDRGDASSGRCWRGRC